MIVKKYYDMTEEEKTEFLRQVEVDMMRSHGVPWKLIEPKILSFLDNAFDDRKMEMLPPDDLLEAVLCRKEFNNKKPELVDYLLWYARMQTQSDDVLLLEAGELPE